MNFTIPSKDEIRAIGSLFELEDLRDDLERCILNIEAQLEFRDDTSEWEARAIGALSIARYALKNVNRRIYTMKGVTMPAKPSQEQQAQAAKTKQQQKTETIVAATVQSLHLSNSLLYAINTHLEPEEAAKLIDWALDHQTKRAETIMREQCSYDPEPEPVDIHLFDFDGLDFLDQEAA